MAKKKKKTRKKRTPATKTVAADEGAPKKKRGRPPKDPDKSGNGSTEIKAAAPVEVDAKPSKVKRKSAKVAATGPLVLAVPVSEGLLKGFLGCVEHEKTLGEISLPDFAAEIMANGVAQYRSANMAGAGDYDPNFEEDFESHVADAL